MFSPPSARHDNQKKNHEIKQTALPLFRKNIYTKQIIDFILKEITSDKTTKNQVIERYNIPKATLYKWISKYGNSEII
ncbi:hypothetical protein BA768_17055 [Chryseobacterium sp. CBo1]|nr:hypothetical protein BA768_17055 [Chryseobacterium sp. CBo1]